jgi:peptide/nickel transport system permease protein
VRRLVARRAAQAVLVVLGAATLAFALLHLAPGDPYAALVEQPGMDADTRARVRAAAGLDRPLPVQYAAWLGRAVRGDLGTSLIQHRPVTAVIGEALPRTVALVGAALVIAVVAGVVLGTWQAARPGSRADRATSAAALVVHALPEFWLAVLAVAVGAEWLGLFPATGTGDAAARDVMPAWQRLLDTAHHAVLPVGTLAVVLTAALSRYQRAAVLAVAHEPFVAALRARGLPERVIVRRHLARHAAATIATLVGLAFPAFVGGAVFVERVYGWPGLGTLTLDAVATRDYPLVQGLVVLGAALAALGSMGADLIAWRIDPRLAEGRSR